MPSAKYAPVTRDVAPCPARSLWMRTFPRREPKPPATQSSSASLADGGAMGGEVPGLLREVLERDVLELRALLDEELDGGVRVAGRLGRRRRVLLDEREAAALLGHDEQPPERRAALVARDADVERVVELDALRNADEQAALPGRGVVRGELVVGADERAQALVVFRQRLRTRCRPAACRSRSCLRQPWPVPATSISSMSLQLAGTVPGHGRSARRRPGRSRGGR